MCIRDRDARLTVALPTVVKETTFGFPSLRKRRFAVQRPLPINPEIKRFGELANLGLALSVASKIRGCSEHSGEQQGGIDQRQLTLPDPPAALHLKEVIIETLVTSRVRRFTLRAVREKTERGESSLGGGGARDPAALDSYGVGGQRESDSCDATGRPCLLYTSRCV